MFQVRRASCIFLAAAVAGCGGGGSEEAQVALHCPLICVTAPQVQGCLGGCVAPASALGPVYASANGQLEAGFLIRGSGPNGSQGEDLRFEITVRRVQDGSPLECLFTIDGTESGSRIH